MSKQVDLMMKIMTYGIPDEVQDIIGDKLQEYKGTGKTEEVAGKILDIIEEPGDMSDIVKKIQNI